mmetsp:Transcript_1874/g.4031  ORF Transcript_1874/g.4031 Transcript_1874/m.4031 type:complete len:380 (-) Transcript_1874:24-1163(-)
MQSEDSTFTLQTLLAELNREYFKSVRSEAQTKASVIAYADIQVWFYNRDCQRALTVVKRIWDKVPGSPLGTKQLEDFLTAYARKLMQRHQKYKAIYSDIMLMKKCLDRANEVLSTMRVKWGNEIVDSPVTRGSFDWSGALEKYQTRQMFNEVTAFLLSIHYAVKAVQIEDLDSAFSEGFRGYSLAVFSPKGVLETPVSDVFGNSVTWNAMFELQLHVNDRPIGLVMYEHFIRNSCPTKTPVAKLDLDIFAYVARPPPSGGSLTDMTMRGAIESAPVEKLQMQTTSTLMTNSPTVSVATTFSVNQPKQQVEVIKQRIEALLERLNQLKGELQTKVTELSLQLSAFPKVLFDEKKLYLAKEERFNCFSSCSGKKDKKCLVM